MSETDGAILRGLFDVAVEAARPGVLLPAVLPDKPAVGRTVVVAIGKAAASMAAALESAWGPCDGIALTRYGHGLPLQGIELIEAAHPVPDAAGQAGAARILELAQSLGAEDTLVVLISGGASSLMSMGLGAITLDEKIALTQSLLASGATITEMNTVRRHVSALKGGRLAAAAYPARCLSYAISDVPGDSPEAIGSGPTVPDPTTQAQAGAVMDRYSIAPTPSIAAVLADPSHESPKASDVRLSRATYALIASPQMMLVAASKAAPVPCHMLGDAIEGEAREAGRVFAGLARAVRDGRSAFSAPCLLLSGGETTVSLPKGASGRGGRNVEFLMGFAQDIAGLDGITAIACDTDGIDGAAEVAGAVVDGTTKDRAEAAKFPLDRAMADYDGHGLFERLGDQVVTGPTHTNVNDFRAILIR